MDKLSREKKDILIMGDFKINLLNYNNDKDNLLYNTPLNNDMIARNPSVYLTT